MEEVALLGGAEGRKALVSERAGATPLSRGACQPANVALSITNRYFTSPLSIRS